MKSSWPGLLLASLLFLFSPPGSSSSAPKHPAGPLLSDGHACVGCVLMVSIVEQLVQVHNSTMREEMERLCSYLPEKLFLRSICYLTAEMFGPDIIKLLSLKMNADVVCHALQFCKQEDGQPLCHLYNPPQEGLERALGRARKIVRHSPTMTNPGGLMGICSIPALAKICQKIEYALSTTLPFEDADGDKFSVFPTLRGFSWRGRDCNDRNRNIYPGRRPENWDARQDSNCNGIWGPRGFIAAFHTCSILDNGTHTDTQSGQQNYPHCAHQVMGGGIQHIPKTRTDQTLWPLWASDGEGSFGDAKRNGGGKIRQPGSPARQETVPSCHGPHLFTRPRAASPPAPSPVIVWEAAHVLLMTGPGPEESFSSSGGSQGAFTRDQAEEATEAQRGCGWHSQDRSSGPMAPSSVFLPWQQDISYCSAISTVWLPYSLGESPDKEKAHGPNREDGKTFSHLPMALSNELDWPQLSGPTGFLNSTSGFPDQSIYLRLRQRNRCNHRDYQNISKNGASSKNLLKFMGSLSRSQLLDHPAIVIYTMLGNDVCNENIDTVSKMTTPEAMRAHVMETLTFLSSRLPPGSHVILYGLADGRFLWDHLHDRYHPLGQLNKDITYEQLYTFLSCLKVNPCQGWMSSNETLRTLTSERAKQLSNVLETIAVSEKFANMSLLYLDYPFKEMSEEWQRRGGETWQLIEPADGFHPNEVAAQLVAKFFWEKILQRWPQILGKENPFNEEIQRLFGDQGGH
ncbi:acyloxyacyl hydrolase [Petaurus breviceps papuanus]|uniref:acyloxyacyl hydrolase n=1 Tax=Petaurus breviceps papuanus TaxID=3040969 RepID=UPI0036D880E1